MDIPPSATRDSLEDEAGEVANEEQDGVGDVLGVAAAADGVLKGLAGVEFAGGRAGGGFVIDVGDTVAGPNAAVRSRQVYT